MFIPEKVLLTDFAQIDWYNSKSYLFLIKQSIHMKKIVTILFFLMLGAGAVSAQTPITNGGFENWPTSGNIDPIGWSSSDDFLTQFGLGDPHGCEKETTAANVYAGTSSVVLTTKSVAIPTIGNFTIAGILNIGKSSLSLPSLQLTVGGVAYASRPDSLVFAYQYITPPTTTDSGVITVTLTQASSNNSTIPIGSAKVYLSYSSTYSVYKAKINYESAQNPDTLKIQAQSSAALFMNGVDGAQLWLDDVKFVGLDTIFKAYIHPTGLKKGCTGDVIALRTDNLAGDTYQWYRNGNPLPADTNYQYNASVSGRYFVTILHNGTNYSTDTTEVAIFPTPTVALSGNQDTVCNNASPIQLSGGSPAGGNYTVNGAPAQAGSFNPANAGPAGTKTIRYTYTSPDGCSASATEPIYVKNCITGIEVLQADLQIHVYPNPASNLMFIESNEKLVGGTARIYDVQGRLVATTNIDAIKTVINVTNLTNGWYTIQIADANNKPAANAKMSVQK
jgi:hypothetical protein